MIAAPTEIWPVSVGGWIALVLAFAAFCGMLIGWGKMLGKFEDHEKQLVGMSTNYESLDSRLTTIDYAFWGPTKTNGLYSRVREAEGLIDEIILRNNRIDAVTNARHQGALEAGREDRNIHRRNEDKVAFGEE